MKFAFVESVSHANSSGVTPLEINQVAGGFASPQEAYESIKSKICSVPYGPGGKGAVYAFTPDGQRIRLFDTTFNIKHVDPPSWENVKMIIESHAHSKHPAFVVPEWISFEYNI